MQVVIWEIDEQTEKKTGRKSGQMSEGEAKLVILALEASPENEGKRFQIEPAEPGDSPPRAQA